MIDIILKSYFYAYDLMNSIGLIVTQNPFFCYQYKMGSLLSMTYNHQFTSSMGGRVN